MSRVDALNLQVGDVVGGYTLVAPLGGGAMGSVWRARDDGGQDYAIKVLRDSLTSEEDNHDSLDPQERAEQVSARERLRREAMALQRIHHQGVCQIVDMELDDSLAFIVTELIDGLNLHDDVATNGRYTGDDLERLANKLVAAVQAVHAAGIVHRDIKPTNVMISASGPVLVDFGIAMGEGESHVTRTGLVMGTPGFIAPEVIDGAESDEHSDWWSLAAVLAYAACGRPVFGSKPMMAVLERAASGNADLSGLPLTTKEAFQAALSPHRQDRPSPQALLDAISRDALDSPTFHESSEEPTSEESTEVMLPFGTNSSTANDIGQTRQLEEEGFLRNPRLAWNQPLTQPLQPYSRNDQESTATLVGNTSVLPFNSSYQGGEGAAYPPVPDALIRRRLYLKHANVTIVLVGVLIGGLAALEPFAALFLSGLFLWMLSACGLSVGTQISRELKRGSGHKATDMAIRLATLPWQILKSFLMTLPRVLLLVLAYYITMVVGSWAFGQPHTTGYFSWAALTVRLPLPAGSSLSITGLLSALCACIGWIVVARVAGRTHVTPETAAPSWGDWLLAVSLGAGALVGRPSQETGTQAVHTKRQLVLVLLWVFILLMLIIFVLRGQSLNWAPLPFDEPAI